jgi:hypothetical protein
VTDGSLGGNAFEDPANGLRDDGVGLEPRGLEPLPPLAQVEELEHSGSLDALAMRAVGRGQEPPAADLREGSLTRPQDPAGDADRERGRDQQAQCQEERGLSVHGSPDRVPDAASSLADIAPERIFKEDARPTDNISEGLFFTKTKG